jgi:hypothetical protein
VEVMICESVKDKLPHKSVRGGYGMYEYEGQLITKRLGMVTICTSYV